MRQEVGMGAVSHEQEKVPMEHSLHAGENSGSLVSP